MINYTAKPVIIEECIQYIQTNWPRRTVEPAKCSRDLEYILDALIKDVEDKTTSNITYVANQFWYNDKRQIKSFDAEFDTYDFMCKILSEKLFTEKDDANHLENCILLLKHIIENGPTNKAYNNIQFLATKRRNYKPLTGEVKKSDLDLIIRATSGLVPALSNEYNYRVDLVPDKHKKSILEATGHVSKAALEADKPGYAQDFNYQILASTVFVYSTREVIDDPNIEQFAGPFTKRDPNMINIGIAIWHTVLTAESLGYKTSFMNLSDWKRERVKNILGLNDPNQITKYEDKFGKWNWQPTCFVCIGTEGEINGNTRDVRHEDIYNKLEIH